MKKRRRRRKNQSQNYSVLEPRQLLATTGLTQFDGDSSINSGLIVNGNFDANQIDSDEEQTVSQRVAITEISGWSQSAGAAEDASLVRFFDSPRGTGLHLDDQADVLESVFQDVDTQSGQLYTLAFDLLGRPQGANASADSNDIRILWDDVEVGTFRGISDFWQTFTVGVEGASTDLTRLEIQEVDGAGNDGIGAMVDNFRLVPVISQTFENGSFEDNDPGLIGQDDVPGWNVVADADNRLINVESGTGSDGTRFLNLDRMSDASDILFADTTTEAGGVYFVSFDLRSESGVVGEDEEVRVRWNNEWVGTYRGSADWQSYGFTVRADSDSTRLVFREPGNTFTGDGNGPLLDNVRITRVVSEVSLTLSDTTPFEFTENGDAVAVGSRIDAINSTVDDSISSVTVSLPTNANSGEILRATVGSETQESVDGVLTVSGSRTIADYLAILQSVEYVNTSENPVAGNRVLTLRVFAGGETPAQDNLTVIVTAVPDAPTVDAINNGSATVDEEFTIQATATDPENDSVTWTVSATGTAIEAGDTQPTIDSDGNIAWTPARVGTATFTVRATDPSSLFDEVQFDVVAAALQTQDTGPVLVNSGTDLPLFSATQATDPAIGQTIANFDAETITGGSFNSFVPGVARIYSVMAHHCPFCQQELPEIVEWMETADLTDVEFVAAAVAVDPEAGDFPDDGNYPPFDWFERENFEGTIIVDNPAAKLMDILGTDRFPFLVAVNENGEVVDRFQGRSTTAQLDAALAAIRNSQGS